MLKGFLGKFSGEQRSKLSETYGCHWERGMSDDIR